MKSTACKMKDMELNILNPNVIDGSEPYLESNLDFYELSRRQAKGFVYDLNDDPLLLRQKQNESKVRSYPRRIPIAILRTAGVMVQDTRGNTYIDCLAGAGALPLGYNHPEINREVLEQLQSGLPYQALDIATPAKDAFIQELLNFLPPSFAKNTKIQFCGPSGADAVEAAIKLAKIKTGRNGIIAFHGAYHGMSHGALALTGNLRVKERTPGLMSDVHFFPYPNNLRCSFGLGGQKGSELAARYFNNVLNDPESGIPKPAAIILEPIQGEGGVIPAPKNWLKAIRQITKELDIPLIVDEIQTGVSRTGQHFAFEYADIVPDMIVLSKAIGGGFPLSVLVYNETMDVWRPGEHSGTFRGNQIAMVSGTKTLQIIERDNLTANAKKMGDLLAEKLERIRQKVDCIAEVRGRGLMLGVEIVKGDGTLDETGNPGADPRTARKIQHAALQRGLILELGGRHGSVIRLLPPLIVEEQHIDFICQVIEKSILVTCGSRRQNN